MSSVKLFPAAVIGLVACVLAFAWPSPATGMGLNKCTQLVHKRGGKLLLNRCSSCRVVSVERKRPSDAAPVYRTVTIPKNSRISLSYRGPGRTRIMSDTPCAGKSGGVLPTNKPAPGPCIRFQKKRDGGLNMVNSCAACKTVVVERTARTGERSHQAFSIAPKAYVPVPSKGAALARVISEKSCRQPRGAMSSQAYVSLKQDAGKALKKALEGGAGIIKEIGEVW